MKSERTHPDCPPIVTWYQRCPDVSVARLVAFACVPWVSVETTLLDVLGAARRCTPRGSLTQTGKGRDKAAVAGGLPAVFCIGSEAGHDVGEAFGVAVAEG